MCLVHGADLLTSDVLAEQTVFTVMQVCLTSQAALAMQPRRILLTEMLPLTTLGHWKGRVTSMTSLLPRYLAHLPAHNDSDLETLACHAMMLRCEP